MSEENGGGEEGLYTGKREAQETRGENSFSNIPSLTCPLLLPYSNMELNHIKSTYYYNISNLLNQFNTTCSPVSLIMNQLALMSLLIINEAKIIYGV